MNQQNENKSSAFSHLNEQGEARMVDVGDKLVSKRTAIAGAKVCMSQTCYEQLKAGQLAKGDVISVARIAGIQAAKQTANLIPLCHPLMLNHIDVSFEFDDLNFVLLITSQCSLSGKTGVEMEALTAASIAALTVYDMCKAVDKGIIISDLALVEKQGGKSGHWQKAST